MKCPKCGSYVEDNKTRCFMCGTQINENENIAFNYENNNQDFSNGMIDEKIEEKKEAYNERFNDYRNVDINESATKKDIFDFVSEHKKGIRIFFIILFIVLLIFSGIKIYQYKNKPQELKPVLNSLYYEVGDEFKSINETKNSKEYSISNTVGVDCYIHVSYGISTSANHVNEYFDSIKKKLSPTTDREGNISNELEVYQEQTNTTTINDTTWNYINFYYRSNLDTNQYNILRYKNYSTVSDGNYYDIELANYNNTTTCNASLDNFVKSLKFIK